MPEYIFWQKKTVKARDLNHALKVEKKFQYKFDSVVEREDASERELQPCIGFQVATEDDYEE